MAELGPTCCLLWLTIDKHRDNAKALCMHPVVVHAPKQVKAHDCLTAKHRSLDANIAHLRYVGTIIINTTTIVGAAITIFLSLLITKVKLLTL